MRFGRWTASASGAAAALIATALAGRAEAAAPRPLSPFLSAPDYLAARGADGPGDCLSATYAVVEGSIVERQVVSCPRYLAITEGGATRIYDFATERLLLVEGGEALTMSAHAVAFFRRQEMLNRKRQAVDPAVARGLSPARQETELQTPWSESYVTLDRTPTDGGEVFSKDRDEIARVRYGAPAPAAELRRIAYLFFGLHPVVAEAVAASGSLPAVVSTASGALGARQTTFRLKDWRLAPSAFPFPPSTTMLTADSPILSADRALAPALRRSVDEGPAPAFAVDALLSRAERRLQQRDVLGAYLATLILLWTYEREADACDRAVETPTCRRLREVLVAASQSDDPDMLLYSKASEAEIENAPEQGLAALDSIDTARRDDAFVLDVLRALLLIELRDAGETTPAYPAPDDAIARAFSRALLGAPAMTSALYDAGFDRLRRLDPAGGWTLFDAARAMPQYRGGLADRIDNVERANRRILPYFFLSAQPQQ